MDTHKTLPDSVAIAFCCAQSAIENRNDIDQNLQKQLREVYQDIYGADDLSFAAAVCEEAANIQPDPTYHELLEKLTAWTEEQLKM